MDSFGKYFRIISILLFWLSSSVYGQEAAESGLHLQDSIRVPVISHSLDLMSVPSVSLSADLLDPNQWTELQAPAFDVNQYMRKNRMSESFVIETSVFTPGIGLPVAPYSLLSPFFHSGAVLHQAAYQVGGKFTVGGSSFGMNSIFSPPPVHPSANQWDVRGASMFMQYKVNKNFKIETRISVTGNHHHP